MSLQAKNIKLLTEHDLMMRDIEKRQVGGKRENKQSTIHTITRLKRDLEKSGKQLRQEIENVMKNSSGSPLEYEVIKECEELFE
jgi:hypothetical protein